LIRGAHRRSLPLRTGSSLCRKPGLRDSIPPDMRQDAEFQTRPFAPVTRPQRTVNPCESRHPIDSPRKCRSDLSIWRGPLPERTGFRGR
jgi:hypothetical protein